MSTGHGKYRCTPHKLSQLKMSSHIKLTDVVKCFTGDGDKDVAVSAQKVVGPKPLRLKI